MSEYVDANLRSSNGFKDAIYQGVAQKLKETFGIDVIGEQCKNQVRHQRSIWNHIQELKKKSGVSWDESKKIILMGQEEYAYHIQASPKDATFLNIPTANYTDLKKVCGEGHATGDWAKSGNSKIPLGTYQINLDDDNIDFLNAYMNTTQCTKWTEVHIKDNYEGVAKRTTSWSSKGCLPRKKRRAYVSEGSICEHNAMVADSVAQVANAIQCSTRASEERKIFVELMSELSSIPGFSEK